MRSSFGMAGSRRLQNLKERHKGWVWRVYLSLESRGQRLRRAPLTRVLETARALPDLHSIQLKVAAPEKAARHLYASMGFHPIAIEPQALRMDGQYIDEEHMILNI
jgi:RimJ/RimL family protein N-acetyltransferase